MTNLFSIFDPSTSNNLSLNWFSLIIPLMMIPYNFWMIPSRYLIIFSNLMKFVTNEIGNNISPKSMKNIIVFFTLFWFIMSINLMGLYPYIFTPTSHMLITLTLALPLWLSLMMYGWINMTNHMFIHLVPMSTPMALSSFMVMIETVSNIIRPITLAVRLSANMIAGHLLMSLLSNIYESIHIMYPPTFFILATLIFLEYAVAIIQSYVFITLMSLYLAEIN
uniref:ATP synthase subunit a n=1 Tax=Microdiplogynium sp. XFX TaxID=2695875 RepID=A0A6B9WFI9_9ACAR|nr:ATP synthase subunit 6 [Microdiplogynium sp. XFX]